MKRSYDSQNRYGFRGGYNQSPSYRNAGNPFAHHANNSSNSPSGSRTSVGHSSSNPHFDVHQLQQQQMHAQNLPSLMSTTIPPPFSPTSPPPPFTSSPNLQTHLFHQIHQETHKNAQHLMIRQQQNLPLNSNEQSFLTRYLTLLSGSNYSQEQHTNHHLTQQQQSWSNASTATSVNGDFPFGYDQQSFLGQPPLPPLPPHQPPPPAPSEPPPPIEQPTTQFPLFNSPNIERNTWTQQRGGGQQEGHGRRRNRNRNNHTNNSNNSNTNNTNNSLNKTNGGNSSKNQPRQKNWNNDTISGFGSQSDLKSNDVKATATSSDTSTQDNQFKHDDTDVEDEEKEGKSHYSGVEYCSIFITLYINPELMRSFFA